MKYLNKFFIIDELAHGPKTARQKFKLQLFLLLFSILSVTSIATIVFKLRVLIYITNKNVVDVSSAPYLNIFPYNLHIYVKRKLSPRIIFHLLYYIYYLGQMALCHTSRFVGLVARGGGKAPSGGKPVFHLRDDSPITICVVGWWSSHLERFARKSIVTERLAYGLFYCLNNSSH